MREYRRSAATPTAPSRPAGSSGSTPTPRRATTTAASSSSGPTGMLWFATGDGGGATTSSATRSDLGEPRSASCCGSTRAPATAAATRSRPTTRSAPRCGPTACATRSASPSTPAAPATSSSATSARARARRSTGRRFADGPRRAPTTAGPCREGTLAGPRPARPAPSYLAPIFDYAQAGPRAVTGGFVVRDPGLPSLFGRYVYADTYDGIVRSFVPGRPRATDDRTGGLPARDLLVVLRRGRLRPRLRGLARRQRRPRPGRRRPAACVLRPDAAPLARPRGAPPRRRPSRPSCPTAPRRGCGSRWRARAASACARRRGSRSPPREACRVTVTARVGKVKLKRVRTPLRGGRRTILRLRPTRKGAQRLRDDAAAPAPRDAGRLRRRRGTRPATPAACSAGMKVRRG